MSASGVEDVDGVLRDVAARLKTHLGFVVTVLLAISTVAPFLAFVFNLFDLQGAERIFASALLGLFLLVVTEAIAIYVLMTKLVELQGEQSNDVFYSLAFSIILNDDTQAIDDQHHYEFQKNVVDMSGKSVEFKKDLAGYNARLDDESEAVPIKLTADSQIQFEKMDLTAEQKTGDGVDEWEPVEPRFVSQPSAFDVIVELPFVEPLDTNESFELRLSCTLGQIPTDETEQFAFLPAHRFVKGIDEFVGELHLPRRFSQGVAKKLGRTSDVSHLRSVGRVSSEDLRLHDIPVERERRKDKAVFSIRQSEAANTLYILKFDRAADA